LLGQYAGLRLGDALNLEWRNVVLRGLKDSYINVEKTKSKKAREIPINSILFDVLTKLKANSGKSKVYFLLRVLELHLQMLVKEQALRISLFMI
jgi:integrase